ncbi:MAG: type IV pili signal transduction protein PilI [Burkholderiaceae bacterium]|jgi:twitching motility protein PilI|nr:MAG: type IV pili signal transduction protein PilI [Burkholderiaceae bacterium]
MRMANREALREFQSRLTERLSAARSTGLAASWLAVEAAQRNFLFPLAQSGEIFPWTGSQPVPYTRRWFLGVSNLRGGLYGIVDLGNYLQEATPAAEPAREQARLVALSPALNVSCALLIDRLIGLRGVDAFVESAPAASDAPAYFGSRYADAQGLHWQEINLQLLSQQPQFLSIGA